MVAVRTALQDAGIDYESAEATFLPSASPCRSTRTAPARSSGSIEALEDSDEVQNVFANFDVPDEVMAALRLSWADAPDRLRCCVASGLRCR